MPASAQQSRLRTDGRFFRLGGRRVFLKAVTFGPFPADARLDPSEEFPRIAAAGFDAVRTYEAPSVELLDAAGRHGLTVLAGVAWEWQRDFLYHPRFLTEAEMQLSRFLKRHADHPALGAVFVANEVPSEMVRWMEPLKVRHAIEGLIATCREVAPGVPLAYANYPSTEYLEPRNADFTACNVYLEDRQAFRDYLPRLQNIAGDRPVLLTELGLDTVRNEESRQADTLEWQIEEALAAGCAGTTIYAWSDRWGNGGRSIDDWAFGLTRRDRSAKPALERIGSLLPRIATHRDALGLEEAPRISVVVCTFNGAERLRACLSACLAMDYPAFEVVVVDDGSTDATPQVVEKFPGVRSIRQEHAGLSAARNRGASEATGEILAYTDDDCEPDPDWLFWLARAFADPETMAAGGPNLPPDPEGAQEAVVAAAPGAPSHVLLDDTTAEHLPGCNLAVRRSALETVGGFQEQFDTAGDDVDLCWRFLDRGWRLAFAPCAFVWHRRRPTLPRFLLQQVRYGRAEALLHAAHPDRFAPGGIRWEGCVYTGAAVAVDACSVIYHGPLGDAPYQGVAAAMLPRRSLHPDFDAPSHRFLLGVAATLQPLCRAWGRWRHGGPRPLLRRAKAATRIYRDDLRNAVQVEFGSVAPDGRRRLLDVLQQSGWTAPAGTGRWDLERLPFRILTATERIGPGYSHVLVRLLFPPGTRRQALETIDLAADDAGLDRLD